MPNNLIHEFELSAAEKIILNIQYQASEKADPLVLTLTDRAVYFLNKKKLAASNPFFEDKIMLEEIKAFKITRLRSWPLIIPGALLALAGLYLIIAMMIPVIGGEGGKVSGLPPALFVLGLALPLAGLGRYKMEIIALNKNIKWKMPFIFGKGKKQIKSYLEQIARAFYNLGGSMEIVVDIKNFNLINYG